MMNCENCGSKIKDNKKFCNNCGKEVYGSPKKLQDKHIYNRNYEFDNLNYLDYEDEKINDKYKEIPKLGLKISLLLFIGILTLFIGFFAGTIVFSSNGQEIPNMYLQNQSNSSANNLDFNEFKSISSKGKNKTLCPNCGGCGWLVCPQCNGSNYISCPNCKMSGIDENGKACKLCDESGVIKCPNCKGNGKIECKNCDGEGYLSSNI